MGGGGEAPHADRQTVSSLHAHHKIFGENLAAIRMHKAAIKLMKSVYTGMSILELGKLLMYKFYYDHLKQLYGDKSELLYTETDFLLPQKETGSVYKDMKQHQDLFDTSDYLRGGLSPFEDVLNIIGRRRVRASRRPRVQPRR